MPKNHNNTALAKTFVECYWLFGLSKRDYKYMVEDKNVKNSIDHPLGTDNASCYTVVLSDLHLCEAETPHPQRPFWKKYKTREFFFDDNFKHFLEAIHQQAQGQQIELVLNGDVFDFDSVTSIPDNPSFKVTWLEKKRGLNPEEDKAEYKIQRILNDHPVWVEALSGFIKQGHTVVIVVGNHDLELHFKRVQKLILESFELTEEQLENVRFCEFFYVSQGDTLIEHGNQYDPFCLAYTPVRPFIIRDERIQVRIPFGNLATRYLINGMGYFNPYSESNYIMTAAEYVRFFFKYMIRTQPLIIWTWLWSSITVLWVSLLNRITFSVNDPLTYEAEIETIAEKANATPRMVREMLQLAVAPATSSPMLVIKELWLDRAFLFLVSFLFLLQIFFIVDRIFSFSFYWILLVYLLFLPFFVFYSKTITSDVQKVKEPKEKILTLSSLITGVNRVVYGHTHKALHEIIGPVEHLNSGTWSPNFKDVECTVVNSRRNYVLIKRPPNQEKRVASLEVWEG